MTQKKKTDMGYLVGAFMLLLFLGGMGPACTPLKPYEKEYLLEPVMGDEVGATLSPQLILNQAGTKEKLLSNGSAGGVGTSCPTCGG